MAGRVTCVLRDMRAACCQVLEAHSLSLWDESSGFAPPLYTLGLPPTYDTFVKLKLTSGRGAERLVHQEERTGTIEGSRDPMFLRSFEFLAQPASRSLEVRVVNTAFVGKGRIQDKVIGEVSLLLSDVAQCPGSKVSLRRSARLFSRSDFQVCPGCAGL